MIGIGISTQSRSQVFMQCIQAVAKLSPDDAYIVVCDDASNDDTAQVFSSWMDRQQDKRIGFIRNEQLLGIPKTKNALINALMAHPGIDDIFLVEDDVIPLRADWHEIFLRTAWDNFVAHLLYMPTAKDYGTTFETTVSDWPIAWKQFCSGMVMYFRRKLLEEVGGFNENFKRYGFDHNELTSRCLLAQQYHPAKYPHCVRAETDSALLSKDVEGHQLRKPVPSSTTKEQKRDFAMANQQAYLKLMNIYRAKHLQEFQNVPWQDRRWHRESAYFK